MEVNDKSDVYSFGVLALEIVFGEHPVDFINSSLWTSSSNVMDLTFDIPSWFDLPTSFQNFDCLGQFLIFNIYFEVYVKDVQALESVFCMAKFSFLTLLIPSSIYFIYWLYFVIYRGS